MANEQDTKTPPPNPHYQWVDVCSLGNGQATLTVSAPGGEIHPLDAQEVVDWLRLILKRYERKAGQKTSLPDPYHLRGQMSGGGLKVVDGERTPTVTDEA